MRRVPRRVRDAQSRAGELEVLSAHERLQVAVGTGSMSPQSREHLIACTGATRLNELPGSVMCSAPRSCTSTAGADSGGRAVPVAPAMIQVNVRSSRWEMSSNRRPRSPEPRSSARQAAAGPRIDQRHG